MVTTINRFPISAWKPIYVVAIEHNININPAATKSSYFNFHKQLQADEKNSHLFNLKANIYKYWCLNTHCIITDYQYQWFNQQLDPINPCPAELLQLYFSTFEAGIANAISSFKWRKILLLMKNRHV